MNKNHFDYIVVGVGSMGSSTSYYLSETGARVLGIEQFNIIHRNGAHTGQTRIVRKAYYEHPDYVPLLNQAYLNWNYIEEVSGVKLFHKTGLFYAGPHHSEVLENVRLSASLYNIPISDSRKHAPLESMSAFSLPPEYEWLYEPDAGYVEPELVIDTYVSQSRKNKVEFHENEKCISWDIINGVVHLKTNLSTYTCNKIIVTAGPWSASLMPSIQDKLAITRQVLAWVTPDNQEHFMDPRFPCWMIEDETSNGLFYGFPIVAAPFADHPVGLKIGYHHPGIQTDPNQVNRIVDENDTDLLLNFFKKYIPSAQGKLAGNTTCLYSNSYDANFVIGTLEEADHRVIFARGFSGHGFKFVPVIGEILKDLAVVGSTQHPISFLHPSRFT